MRTKITSSASLAANWEKKMRKSGKKFAALITTRATYDRVAVVDKRPNAIVIQYPKGTTKKRNLNTANCGNESFTITQETILNEDIRNIRYYQEN